MQLNQTKLKIDGSKLKVAIVIPYFNREIGEELLENCEAELKANRVSSKNIQVIRVAGALEIPFACQKTAETKKPNVIIALGAVIRGETSHYDLVCNETYRGIMNVQLDRKIPIIFGILTCENQKQALNRSSKKGLNKGAQSAQAALIQATI